MTFKEERNKKLIKEIKSLKANKVSVQDISKKVKFTTQRIYQILKKKNV